NLQRWFADRNRAAFADVNLVDLRDPPIVVAGSGSPRCDKHLVVSRPIEIVNVQFRWRSLAKFGVGETDNRDPLIVDCFIDNTGAGWRRQQRAASAGALYI